MKRLLIAALCALGSLWCNCGAAAAAGAAPGGVRVVADFADGTAQGWKASNCKLSVTEEKTFDGGKHALRVEAGQWGANFGLESAELAGYQKLRFQLWGELKPGKQKIFAMLWVNGSAVNGWIGPDKDGGFAAGKWVEVTADLSQHRRVKSVMLQVYDAAPLYVGRITAEPRPPGSGTGEPGVPAKVEVSIDETKVLYTVPETYHGTNFVALWNSTGDSPGAVKALGQMGVSFVRFPGGVPCQWYDWKEPLASGSTVQTPARAWALAKAAGAKMIFQTNSANSKEDTNKKTGKKFRYDNSGAHQAEWVTYCREQGIEVAFWEIGNEPEMDAPAEHKKTQEAIYAWYNAKFKEQAEAIRKADPKARIMGPAATNTWFWWAQHNLEKFLQAHGNKEGTGLVDAVSLHWYPDAGGADWEKKRGAAQEWEKCAAYIREVTAKYDSRELPLYITEWNWGAGDKNDSGRKLSNALGNADCIGMFLRTGVAGQTHFCLQRIKRGWGVLACNHDDSRPDDEPAPTYFALALAAKLKGAVLATKAGADEKNVLSAYATRDARGALAIMLINKTGQKITAEVKFAKLNPAGAKAQVYSLRGADGDIDDEEVIYNGVRAPKPNREALPPPQTLTVGAKLAPEVPAYAMVVLVVPEPG